MSKILLQLLMAIFLAELLRRFLKKFFPDLFVTPRKLIKETTPSFLAKKRMELKDTQKYIRWLKKRLKILESLSIEREMKGLTKDPSLEEVLKLLESELKKFGIKS